MQQIPNARLQQTWMEPEQMAVLAVFLRDMHERGVDYREVLGRNGIEIPKRASRDEGQPDVKA